MSNMTLTAELSFYPLTEAYEQRVIDFVKELRAIPNLQCKIGGMSSMISGSHDDVFNALSSLTRKYFADAETQILVVKFLNRNAFDDPTIH